MSIPKKAFKSGTLLGRNAAQMARLLKRNSKQAFSTTELVESSGLTQTEAQAALRSLVEAGAVESKPISGAVFWIWK